ncbi:MAG: hypothetical protein ABSG86_06740 [Thermoguttaceae bacterium]|jgi:hypothetical protein
MATFDEIRALKNRHSADLLRRPGVSGLDIETDKSGEATLTVHVDTDDPAIRRQLPEQLEGFPLKYRRTGPFRKQ